MLELPSAVQLALVGFVAAASIVILLTPLVGRLARGLGVVVRPTDERHMHVATMPLLGGLAMYAGVLAATLAFVPMENATRTILVGGTIITVVGLVDDLYEIKPLLKFGGQLLAIAVLLYFDVRIERFSLPGLDVTLTFHPVLADVITVVWVAAIVNMVNFIDGLDGLAAGVCAISAVTFSVLALTLNRDAMGIEAAILAGAAFAFLRFNFYPASIFMGDAGSMLLGFVLGVLSVQGVLKGAATVALIFPLLVLGVPFIDLFLVVFRRWRQGVPIYAAGKDHVHHDLVLIAGFSQRKTVLLLYGWCLLLNGLALAMRFRAPVWMLVLGVPAAVATATMIHRLRQYRARAGDELFVIERTLRGLGQGRRGG